MPYFDHDGVSISYIDEPMDSTNRPIALLIHGWTCDVTDWSFQIPFLHHLGYRTVAYDCRGHGHSSIVPSGTPEDQGDLRFATLADDGAGLLAHLNITQPVVVMGHSAGGMVASIFTLRHPQMTKALVVIDSPYYREAGAAEKTMAMLDAPETMDPTYTTTHQVAAQLFRMGAYDSLVPDWIPAWHETRRASMAGSTIKEFYEANFIRGRQWTTWNAVKEEFSKDKRSATRLVVLINEERVTMEKSLGMDELDHVQFLEGGHWPHQSNAKAFNEILEKWLGRLGLLPNQTKQ